MGTKQRQYYRKHRQSELDRNKKYRELNKERLAKKHYEYCRTVRGRFNKLLKDIRKRAGTDITIEDLELLWEQQGGRCALSNLPMTYNHVGPSPDAVTIDRIRPHGPYELSNIRFVSKWANMARNTLTDSDFRNWCKLVVEGIDDRSTEKKG